MVYIAIKGGRGEKIDSASVAGEGRGGGGVCVGGEGVGWVWGGGGVSKQKGCLQRIVLIRAQKLRTKRISCKGQALRSSVESSHP